MAAISFDNAFAALRGGASFNKNKYKTVMKQFDVRICCALASSLGTTRRRIQDSCSFIVAVRAKIALVNSLVKSTYYGQLRVDNSLHFLGYEFAF
jgi:hypothetical protein